MQIRVARATDIPGIVVMAQQLQEYLERVNPRIWSHRIDAEKQTVEFEDYLKFNSTRVFVAEESGQTMGFAIGTLENRGDDKPSVVGVLKHIFVKEERRGEGIGRKLVAELLDFFESRGVEDVVLHHVAGNQEAERFWNALGFETVIHTAVAYPEEIRRRM